ncbi:ectonucleoside triphosphate diphosphohydrolase 2-like [Patiria miniata]|uniref:Uncharacterized protein n=1 Tax=Patiria miniata TaxID=46514 RepID=A0A913Z3T3_PATMI|nr:ectonucleoside triphosphate diphosphohydrolase 2-like [Patiria miniata]
MAGGLKCNPLTVSLVIVGTLLAITCMFVFVITNVPLDFDTCEEEPGVVIETEIIRYGIVIRVDAESAQPKLFSWSYDINRTMSRVQRQQYSCKHKTKAVKNPQAFRRSCLDEIRRIVPRDHRENTEIYLVRRDTINSARLVPNLASVRSTIASYPFNTSRADLADPSVITDDDLARYRWVAENDALGTVHSDLMKSNDDFTGSLRPTHGLLDMGSISARVTFAVSDGGGVSSSTRSNGARPVQLYGRDYALYTRSFPCYGLLEVGRWFKEQLVSELYNSSFGAISNPCAPSGFTETLSSPRKGSPCSTQTLAQDDRLAPTDAGETERSNQTREERYTLEGVGNSTDCHRRVRMLTLEGEELPEFKGDFIAFFPELPFDVADISGVDSYIDATYCNWTGTPAEAFSREVNSTGVNSCFVMIFLRALIFEGFKIDQTTWERAVIRQEESTTAQDPSWLQGFMAATASEFPPPPGPCVLSEENRLALERKQATVTALILLILGGLLIVGLGYGIACRRGGDNNWVPSPLAMYQFQEG